VLDRQRRQMRVGHQLRRVHVREQRRKHLFVTIRWRGYPDRRTRQPLLNLRPSLEDRPWALEHARIRDEPKKRKDAMPWNPDA